MRQRQSLSGANNDSFARAAFAGRAHRSIDVQCAAFARAIGANHKFACFTRRLFLIADDAKHGAGSGRAGVTFRPSRALGTSRTNRTDDRVGLFGRSSWGPWRSRLSFRAGRPCWPNSPDRPQRFRLAFLSGRPRWPNTPDRPQRSRLAILSRRPSRTRGAGGPGWTRRPDGAGIAFCSLRTSHVDCAGWSGGAWKTARTRIAFGPLCACRSYDPRIPFRALRPLLALFPLRASGDCNQSDDSDACDRNAHWLPPIGDRQRLLMADLTQSFVGNWLGNHPPVN
jgi:hypothetical protein